MNRDKLIKLVDEASMSANENFKNSDALKLMSETASKNIEKNKTIEDAVREAVLLAVDMSSTLSSFILVETLNKLFDLGILIENPDLGISD